MSFFHVDRYSAALSRIVDFYVVLPDDMPPEMITGNPNYERERKTLYLLHGFSGNAGDWITGSNIRELAGKYNLAVVMPSGENSFYLNGKGTGRAYETYTAVELVEYCQKAFGLSSDKEDNFIAGLSMGGFGAIHSALKYPHVFGKAVGLSSALIADSLHGMTGGDNNGIADYDYYVQTFGDLDKILESDNNPSYLVRKHKKEGQIIPALYMACGTEDFLIEENRSFHRLLQELDVDVTYHESPGIHDWKFWNEYLEPSIQWLLG